MKYCLRYQKSKEAFMKKADELLIRYEADNLTLLDFLLENKEKRTIILIDEPERFFDDDELKKFIAFKEKYPDLNFTFCLDELNFLLIAALKENNFSFFTRIYVNNWDTFRGLLDLGVSDVYIVESMGFELDKCSAIAHEKNVKIRVFPNIAQSQWEDTMDIKKFFIRPEDVYVYEDYVDIFEFLGDIRKDETLYTIYAEDKEWYGDLTELITGLNTSFDSRFIIPKFAEIRVRCGKKCMKDNKCQICEMVSALSNSLKSKGVTVEYPNKEK